MRILLPLLLAACVGAVDYTIDLAASKVAFSGTSTLHDFGGSARLVSGSLHLDPSKPSGEIDADAASMATGSAGRDERMHSFVMEAGTYPRVSFVLTAWAPASGGGTATGTWTMKGVPRPVTIPVAISGEHATAHLALNIRDWGIKTPRLLFVTVGDTVQVDLDLVLHPAP
jgi:polyisoprenoid-binding protein YceI